MSDCITYEPYPVCGALATFGWETWADPCEEPSGQVLVEFDCPNGCAMPQSVRLIVRT